MHGLDCLGATLIGSAAPSLDDVRAGRGTIKKGMSGAAVEYVQALAPASVDGNFGPATEDAVKRFQAEHGLPTDGVVGRETLAVMDKLAGGGTKGVEKVDASAATPTVAPTSTPAKSAALDAGAAAISSMTETKTKPATIAGYVLGAAALGGIGYAILRGR